MHEGTRMKRRTLVRRAQYELQFASRYLQTGPASVKKVALSENHPLTPIEGAP